MPTKRTMGSVILMAPRSRETLFLHHRPRVVERLAKAGHHLVDLGLVDDQWWAEGDVITRHVAQYRPVMLCAAHEVRGHAGFRVEALLGRLVTDELDSADQPDAARLTDQRMVGIAAD